MSLDNSEQQYNLMVRHVATNGRYANPCTAELSTFVHKAGYTSEAALLRISGIACKGALFGGRRNEMSHSSRTNPLYVARSIYTFATKHTNTAGEELRLNWNPDLPKIAPALAELVLPEMDVVALGLQAVTAHQLLTGETAFPEEFKRGLVRQPEPPTHLG